MALLEKLGFLGGGANEPQPIATKEEIDRKRKLAQMLMQQGSDTSPVQDWTQGAARLAQALDGVITDYQATKTDRAAQAEGRKIGADWFGGSQASTTPNVGSVATPTGNIPANAQPQVFLDTLKQGGLTNPNALAAVGATGHHESRWSPDKIAGSWSDPSESGQAGTSGGALSWRAERLDNLRKFAAANGEQGNGSLATQARFFMQEDPSLVAKLNASKSPEEAMQHMNNAWRFAGYNREGGEAAARLASAGAWLNKVAPGGGAPAPPVQVASADPNFRPQTPGAVPAPEQPPQVAQAGPAPAMPQTGGASEPTLQQLLAARNNPAFDRAPAGTQALVNALIQKKVTQETKDPLDQELKRLNIQKIQTDLGNSGLSKREVELRVQKAEQEAGLAPLDRRQRELAIQKAEREASQAETPQVVREVEARKAAAAQIGLKPEDPAYKGYIATGKMPREDAQPLSATDKKAILEADEGVLAGETAIKALGDAKKLSPLANAGVGASLRAKAGNALPDWMVPDALSSKQSSEATVEYENVVLGQALSQLKSIFGAAPTEGERKILLDLQASANLPDNVRQKVLDRAVEHAQRRLDFNKQRAAELRGNEYYRPKGGKQEQPGASQPGTTPAQADGWQDMGGGIRIREKGAR